MANCLGITIHRIDGDFCQRSTILELESIRGDRTGGNLAEAFEKTLATFGVWARIGHITTDEGSDMLLMVRNLAQSIPGFTADNNGLRCLAHILKRRCTACLPLCAVRVSITKMTHYLLRSPNYLEAYTPRLAVTNAAYGSPGAKRKENPPPASPIDPVVWAQPHISPYIQVHTEAERIPVIYNQNNNRRLA
jgi:hypothetical protein